MLAYVGRIAYLYQLLPLLFSFLSFASTSQPKFPLLPHYVWRVVVKDQVRFSLCQVEDHFRKVTVGPGKPGSSVIRRVVNVDTLVNQAETIGVVDNEIQSLGNLLIVVGTINAGYLRHWPWVGQVDVGAAAQGQLHTHETEQWNSPYTLERISLGIVRIVVRVHGGLGLLVCRVVSVQEAEVWK